MPGEALHSLSPGEGVGMRNPDSSALVYSRTALSEKKPTVKPKSPEKSKPDEKDPEKSPTKKQEGKEALGA